MIPFRCFTCNNFIAEKFAEFENRKDNSKSYKHLLDELGLYRFCCRRMLLTHVNFVDDTAMYSALDTTMDQSNTKFSAYNPNQRIVTCD